MQALFLNEEKQFLLNPNDSKVPRLVTDLNLFLDADGLMRTRERIGKSEFYDYEVLYPILWPRNSHLIRLMILNSHQDCKHLGISATLNRLRLSGFWIFRARQSVKTDFLIGEGNLKKKKDAYILFKDHKPNFVNKLKFRLINPSKTELGKVSKNIIQNILTDVKKANHCNYSGEVKWLVV